MSEPMQVPPPCEFELDKLVIRLDEIVSSDLAMVDGVVARILKLIAEKQCRDDMQNLDLALREALVNAILHGNRCAPTKVVRICVALAEDRSVLIIVKDAGSGFDPSQLPNPVMGENLWATHGRGIFLINRLMDDVKFSFENGTAIYMRRSSDTLRPPEPANSEDSRADPHGQNEDGN